MSVKHSSKGARMLEVSGLRPQTPRGQRRGKTTGFAILRLSPERVPDLLEASQARAAGAEPSLMEVAEAAACGRLKDVLTAPRVAKTSPLVSAVPTQKLLRMERSASGGEHAPLRSLAAYWRLDLRDRSEEEARAVVAELARLPEVDAAYLEPLPMPATVTPGDDPYNTS
jgi:hypothetical protein